MPSDSRLPAIAAAALVAVVLGVVVTGHLDGAGYPWATTPRPPRPPAARQAPQPAPASRGPLDAQSPVVVLVDHSDPRTWQDVRAAMAAPVFESPEQRDPFYASLTYVDEAGYEGLTPQTVLPVLDRGYRHAFAVLVDHQALASPEHPVLVVGVRDAVRGRTFRALPRTLQAIENNLSISNMDFEEFAAAAGPDGVFRGFRPPGTTA